MFRPSPFATPVPFAEIGFVEVLDLQILNALRHGAPAHANVADQTLLRLIRQQTKQIARLRVIRPNAGTIERHDHRLEDDYGRST